MVGYSLLLAFAAAEANAAEELAEYLELDPSVKELEVKNFDFPDRDIKDVVALIAKWTGKNFILDSKVQGKISILGPSPITLPEAYRAFLSALEANKLTTVQAGKFIRIIPSADAQHSAVETFSGDFVPDTEQIITRIFQLRYINAEEVQREFRELIPAQGKIFAYEPTNSIILTDTGANIRRVEGILKILDVKNFESTLRVMKIGHSSAKNISEILSEIYGGGKGGGSESSRGFRRSALERTRGGGVISKIVPDEATNSLLVLANDAGYAQLQELVGKLDVKATDTGRIHVYYCEYAKAEDLAATLLSLSGGGKATASQKSRPTPTDGGGSGSAAPAAGGPITAELEGGIKITSDAATNSLVISAGASDYQTVKRVLRKLDIPRLQVFVEAAILEVILGGRQNIGVNVASGAPNVGLAGGFIGDRDTLTTVLTRSGLPEGATIPILLGSSFPATFGAGPAAVPITVASFMGLLNLITKTTNSSVLSTPQIIALDNEKAEFKALDETPVQTGFTPAAAGSALPAGTATGSIERLKTGISIKLTPHINAASQTIRLEIDMKVDNVKATAEIPQALEKVQRATTSRSSTTSVVVRDADYIMLGGLMSDTVQDAVSKVPLLGDIPVLGWLFKTKNTISNKTNLIILLHPKIIATSLDAANTIDGNLKTRREFIEKHTGGEPELESQTDKYQREVDAQKRRAESEGTPFPPPNNADEEGDSVPSHERGESELDRP